jgi:DNA-binding XRE family transcriptional regulator
MSNIQFIERNGQREYAIVPMPLFVRMAALLEERGDEALYDQAKAADTGFAVPSAVVDQLLAGAHPVKAWREHHQLTQDALAAQAGISTAYLCQIETGKRQGAVKTLKALARALGVSLDDLQG